jgi:hypothetical protein
MGVVTQTRWTPTWPEAELEGPDASRPAEAARRRARDRFVQIQPPPPHPEPARPEPDDEEPSTDLPAGRANDDDRLLAEIDELIAACERS